MLKRSRFALPHDQYKKLCREVMQRDGWKCRVKGCKLRQNLHCHHVVYRSHQGHDIRQNLMTMCDGCHTALHNRYVLIKQGDTTLIDTDKPVVWEFIDGWLPGKRL